MAVCETVKIDDGKGGYSVINKSDFNAKTQTVYGKKKPVAKAKPVAKKAAK